MPPAEGTKGRRRLLSTHGTLMAMASSWDSPGFPSWLPHGSHTAHSRSHTTCERSPAKWLSHSPRSRFQHTLPARVSPRPAEFTPLRTMSRGARLADAHRSSRSLETACRRLMRPAARRHLFQPQRPFSWMQRNKLNAGFNAISNTAGTPSRRRLSGGRSQRFS